MEASLYLVQGKLQLIKDARYKILKARKYLKLEQKNEAQTGK